MEVNSSPGSEGIEEANSGLNVAKTILEHFKDVASRRTTPVQCGFEEVVSIDPFGELEAKFDTGNSAFSVLHAEDIVVKGNKITFTLKDKTITTNLIKTYDAKTGGGNDERPVVQLPMEFAGSTYDVMFGLNDRDDFTTECLLNRYVMSEFLNVMVNPARKYVISTKYVLD